MAEELFEKEAFLIPTKWFSGEGKLRVESEVLLPDYKEEAYRLVRVSPDVTMTGKSCHRQGQNLIFEVEGCVTYTVLYHVERGGERGELSSYVSKENFSHRFRIPEGEEDFDPDRLLSHVEFTVENTGMKLLSPRKIALHGDVLIQLLLEWEKPVACLSSRLPEDVECALCEAPFFSLVACHEESFRFTETVHLPESAPAIGEICEMQAQLFAEKCKSDQGAISFLGHAGLGFLYVPENEICPVGFYQPVEFEKHVGLEGVCEGDTVRVLLVADSIRAGVEMNEAGENKELAFEIGYTARIRVYRNRTLLSVCDAYSSRTQLSLQRETLRLEAIRDVVPLEGGVTKKIPFKEGLSHVEGVRAAVEFSNSYVQDGKIQLSGRLAFSYLAWGEDNEIISVNDYTDFSFTSAPAAGLGVPEGEEYRIEVWGDVRSLDLVPEEKELFLRLELQGSIFLYHGTALDCVCEMSRGEALPPHEEGLIYLYPEKGETMWQIAKNMHVSLHRLYEENGLTEKDPLPEVLRIFK